MDHEKQWLNLTICTGQTQFRHQKHKDKWIWTTLGNMNKHMATAISLCGQCGSQSLVFTCLLIVTRYDTKLSSCGPLEHMHPDQGQKLPSPSIHRLRWHQYCYRSPSLVQWMGTALSSSSQGPGTSQYFFSCTLSTDRDTTELHSAQRQNDNSSMSKQVLPSSASSQKICLLLCSLNL